MSKVLWRCADGSGDNLTVRSFFRLDFLEVEALDATDGEYVVVNVDLAEVVELRDALTAWIDSNDGD